MKSNKQSKSIAQQVVIPTKGNSKAKRKTNKSFINYSARDFSTRMEPRYSEMPALPTDLPEPFFSESSQKILRERYLLKGGDLEVKETIPERFWHVAYDIASGEMDFGADDKQVIEKAKDFYRVMVNQKFVPNSPTLMNAGKHNGLQYSACFVLPVEDSLTGIFDSIKAAALIHQTGGGTGFAFSRLRGNGSIVNTTGGVASGPVSFLRVFNAATESIKQGGTRRGANMGILRVDHPDIMEFIRCKSELDDQNKPVYDAISSFLPNDEVRNYFKTLMLDRQISNFNISVGVTDRFMDAYFKGEDFDLVDPKNKEKISSLNAVSVFDEIIERAWSNGDPGLVFIDRMNHNRSNPVPSLEEIEATNPCGEQPLAPWDACNLGSINLGLILKDDNSDFDWIELERVTRLAVDFLDNVVQVNPYTLEEIYDEVHRNRRIGLGVMGWADALFKMQIPYNSDKALALAEKVMKFITEIGHDESEELAKVRGAFPNWQHSIYAKGKPLRNSTVTTIAPTGTISIIADCSSGIEPVFALAYLHRAKTTGDQIRTLTIANKTFEQVAKQEGFYSEDLMTQVMERGSVMGISSVPENWQKVFITAQEIEPVYHVKMQAAFQKYTDNGVSKTINLPNSATREDVKEAYLLAWNTGCNGITVYRDGSKAMQVLNVSNTLNKQVSSENDSSEIPAWARPMILRGRTYKIVTPLGEGFVTVNRDDQNLPYEVFITIGRAGMHTMADAEALGRLISLNLRTAKQHHRREIAERIVRQLRGIGGSHHVGFGKDRIMSLADAVAKVLSEELSAANDEPNEMLPLNISIEEPVQIESSSISPAKELKHPDLCPECGAASFVFEEGCKKCHSCGYSMC